MKILGFDYDVGENVATAQVDVGTRTMTIQFRPGNNTRLVDMLTSETLLGVMGYIEDTPDFKQFAAGKAGERG